LRPEKKKKWEKNSEQLSQAEGIPADVNNKMAQ